MYTDQPRQTGSPPSCGVFLPLSFLFTFTQLPMLLRHGLSIDDKAEVLENSAPRMIAALVARPAAWD